MATIRRRGAKWQVQIRRVGVRSIITRSFDVRKDAEVGLVKWRSRRIDASYQMTPGSCSA
jgi:hypothetical protein